jgi:DNA-binding response OmpR family regulator
VDLLLIVPDRRLRSLLLAQLGEEGYGVAAVPTVRHGRLLLHHGLRPGLVVLDLVALGEPDEAILRLREEAQAPLLALGGAVEQERARRLGLEVLSRPFTIAQLVARIRGQIWPDASAQ